MAVTVYTPAPALTADDNNTLTCFRVLVKLSAASNGQLRVRFRAANANSLLVTGASFGKWNGNNLSSVECGMTTPPFRLKFAGANSGTAPAGGTLTSDLTAHAGVTLAIGDWVIVSFYNGATANGQAGQRYSANSSSTAITMFTSGQGDLSQIQQIGAGWQLVGQGFPLNPNTSTNGCNFSVDLVESNDPSGVTNYTMPAAQGTLTLTRFAANLRATRRMTAAQGSLTFVRFMAGLIYSGAGNKYMMAGRGTFALAGKDAALRITRRLAAATGLFQVTGTATDLIYTPHTGEHFLTCETGTLTFSGQPANLFVTRKPPKPEVLKFGRIRWRW